MSASHVHRLGQISKNSGNSAGPVTTGPQNLDLCRQMKQSETGVLAEREPTLPSRIFDNLLSYKQAAQFLNVSESYLRRLKSQGKVPWVSIGVRGVRFSAASLSKWVREREIR
jgi:excisionase family DNA binding protein